MNVRVNVLEKSYKHFLNKNTILFGASNSGKSTILMEILYLLKDHVPNIFVFSPTADSNAAFDGVVPNPVIYTSIDIKALNSIYERQQGASLIYTKVNNINMLRKVFNIVADQNALNLESSIKRIPIPRETPNTRELQILCEQRLIKLYKDVIRKNKHKILNTSDDIKYVLRYLDFNPRCIVVFDDCGAVLKKLQREEVMRKIIFQGRHNHINLIMTLQDDKDLESSIKKNAFVNIFTTERCAATYFERSSNSFSRKEKNYAYSVISSVFSSRDYKKLVYIRDAPDPFRYTIANIYSFKFGSPKLWKLCSLVKQSDNFNHNPVLQNFRM